MEQELTWTKAHPVVDFYRASKPMAYDSPSRDLAAVLYVARPDAGLIQLSSGSLEALDDGGIRFTAGLREVVTAKPVPRRQRRRFTPEELEKFRREREEERKKRGLERKKAAPKPVPPTRP